MTKDEATDYLFRTSWYEIVCMVSGKLVPDEVARKREEAYEALQKAE